MAQVLVKGAVVEDGRIASLDVGFHGLPDRTVDRDTAIRWMRDGHSLLLARGDERGRALQLVEAGDELFIRDDNAPVPEDRVPL